jgi:xanthine dehydrogenase YagS FAD-binding subunit
MRVRTRYPALAQALLAGASGQLRNLATTGGNLLQRTRCAYFRDPSLPCNKREPGAGCAALDGYTRYHAVLGASEHCVATNPSDMAVALLAFDAVVQVSGPDGGAREVPLADLHRLPGDAPERDTTLRHGELITAVDLPALTIAAHSAYRKVRDRASYAFALVSVAAAVQLDDDDEAIADVRIAFGGLAHAPWRASRAEDALRGGPATEAAFRAAADAELAEARPLRDNAFKVPMATGALVATLRELTGAGARGDAR